MWISVEETVKVYKRPISHLPIWIIAEQLLKLADLPKQTLRLHLAKEPLHQQEVHFILLEPPLLSEVFFFRFSVNNIELQVSLNPQQKLQRHW